MNSIIFYGIMVYMNVLLLSYMPIIKGPVKYLLNMFKSTINFMVAQLTLWLLYLIKIVVTAHVEVLKHLFLPVEKLDPMRKVKNKR